MSDLSLVNQISHAAEVLDLEQQQQVLQYIRTLQQPRTSPKAGAGLLALAGTWPAEDAAEIMKAIDEGCGQINPNAW